MGILHITYGACGSGGLARKSSKLVFLLSACSPIPPPFEAVLMSKDVKSLPGEGRRGGPAVGLAKLSAHRVCVTLVSVLFNTVRVLN